MSEKYTTKVVLGCVAGIGIGLLVYYTFRSKKKGEEYVKKVDIDGDSVQSRQPLNQASSSYSGDKSPEIVSVPNQKTQVINLNDKITVDCATVDLADQPFKLSHMHYIPGKYDTMLRAKVAAIRDRLVSTSSVCSDGVKVALSDGLTDRIEVFSSPEKHYRMKCRFGVTHDAAGDMCFRMWDNGGLGSPVVAFPIADRRIYIGMQLLQWCLNGCAAANGRRYDTSHNDISQEQLAEWKTHLSLRGLRSVTFLASLAGDLVLSMSYKPNAVSADVVPVPCVGGLANEGRRSSSNDSCHFLPPVLDARWKHHAESLKKHMECVLCAEVQTRRVSIIGRAKNEKILLGVDYVEEEFHDMVPAIDPTAAGSRNIIPPWLPQKASTTLYYKQIEAGFSNPNGTVNRKSLTWLMSVVAAAPELRKTDLLEMYCGNGNHTCALAQFAKRVMAVEINPGLVAAAKENLVANQITNAHVLVADSHKFADTVLRRGTFVIKKMGRDGEEGEEGEEEDITFNFGAVLVDPPRCGLDTKTVKLVAKYDHILYISCNPDALFRDLKCLSKTHRIDRFAIFDHFAWTDHLESGVYLRAK